MAWPPIIPPATRSDTTPQLHNHPQDHNQISEALAAIVAAVGVEIQAGTETNAHTDDHGNAHFDFPTAFSHAPSVVVSPMAGSTASTSSSLFQIVGTPTATGATVKMFLGGTIAAPNTLCRFFWVAVAPR